ncbi:MAG: non-heme iron oxygenase ferredoxin subunit [Nitriliruptoraceae bacterium]|nr:non-heme iron oxygenase ferredoxin subunit [Nitriliruptoraceae bacterium]
MTRAAALADLPAGQPVRVDVDGVPVCLVRTEDGVRAIHDTCSHQQWSLADGGTLWGNGVECSLHGSTFDLDSGKPSSLPAMQPVPTFAVTVTDDDVHVDVSSATNGAAFPDH